MPTVAEQLDHARQIEEMRYDQWVKAREYRHKLERQREEQLERKAHDVLLTRKQVARLLGKSYRSFFRIEKRWAVKFDRETRWSELYELVREHRPDWLDDVEARFEERKYKLTG